MNFYSVASFSQQKYIQRLRQRGNLQIACCSTAIGEDQWLLDASQTTRNDRVNLGHLNGSFEHASLVYQSSDRSVAQL